MWIEGSTWKTELWRMEILRRYCISTLSRFTQRRTLLFIQSQQCQSTVWNTTHIIFSWSNRRWSRTMWRAGWACGCIGSRVRTARSSCSISPVSGCEESMRSRPYLTMSSRAREKWYRRLFISSTFCRRRLSGRVSAKWRDCDIISRSLSELPASDHEYYW